MCHGSCGQRIKRNSVYFICVDGTRQWCHKCYNSLAQMIPTSGRNKEPVYKKDLLRRRTDEEIAEPWIECDSCGQVDASNLLLV